MVESCTRSLSGSHIEDLRLSDGAGEGRRGCRVFRALIRQTHRRRFYVENVVGGGRECSRRSRAPCTSGRFNKIKECLYLNAKAKMLAVPGQRNIFRYMQTVFLYVNVRETGFIETAIVRYASLQGLNKAGGGGGSWERKQVP